MPSSIWFIRYLEANLLILVAFIAIWLIQSVGDKGRSKLRYGHLLPLSRILLVCAVLLPLASLTFPKQNFLSPSAQIWHATTMREKSVQKPEVVTVGNPKKESAVSLNTFNSLWVIFLILGATALALRILPTSIRLRRLYRKSHLLKQIGQAEVRVSDEIAIPFSFWIPRRSMVFLPSILIENSEAFMIALRHEIQHHRQRDTRWVYLLELFRCGFLLNPLSYFFVRRISEIQEFACDEVLVDQKNVSPHAYGGCLVRVAETARGSHPVLVGTTCMGESSSGSFLKRRIQIMLREDKRYLNKSVGAFVTIIAVTVMATVAWASQGLVQDRRISIQEATRLAEVAKRDSTFPITINEAVVKELNRYVGTPDGREFIKNALARMENHQTLVEQKLSHYRLPKEIMAMPIMESGYQNISTPTPMGSVGVWQFMPQTARNYGMRVDSKVDERLNVEKATDGACRYLGALYFMFQDWELAVLAYNAGEHKVQRGIAKTGSRNAWTLIEKGFSGDDGYLPKMIAAVLIMNSPSIID